MTPRVNIVSNSVAVNKRCIGEVTSVGIPRAVDKVDGAWPSTVSIKGVSVSNSITMPALAFLQPLPNSSSKYLRVSSAPSS